MKFTLVRNILGLAFVAGLALAKTNNYDKIYSYKDLSTENCDTNKKGEIETIDYYLEKTTTVDERILSLNSLKVLEISCYVNAEHNLEFDRLSNLRSLQIKFKIQPLSDTSGIFIGGKFAKNGLKLPKSLKYLSISGADLNQDVIDEIASLPNLESLDFPFFDTSKLNLENFSKCKSLSSLEIFVRYQDIPDNLISSFKTVKNLTLDDINLNEKVIKDISSLTQLENLSIQIDDKMINKVNIDSLKSLPNLKSFKINYKDVKLSNDLSGTTTKPIRKPRKCIVRKSKTD